jgi:hypothetical protein
MIKLRLIINLQLLNYLVSVMVIKKDDYIYHNTLPNSGKFDHFIIVLLC